MTLVDFDELFRQVSQDVASVNVADQPYLRYISLTNRQTAGVCVDALEPDRQALVKMLNMLATSARIYVPTAINADRTLYRIDLRDLGWDRAIAVQGTNFNDVWEAIAARNPYAVEFIGAGADAAKDGTQTVFPFMFADQMLAVAAIGQLYYAIIGVDVKETLGNFILNELQVDLAQALTNATSILAGTTKSRIARQDRVVRRDELVTRSGALWQAFDVTVSDSNSIFEAPFGVAQDGTEAIFTLPNGMLAFIIADANGAIVPESDRLLDASQDNFLAVTSVSCSRCHTAGVIPVQDEVRAIALANPTSYDSKTLAQVQAMYVSPEEFGRVASQDSQNFYQRALQFAQLPTDGEDPVSSVYQRFDQDMKLADAAGELGVTPDALKNNLNLLSPSLGVLADGSLDRDDFTKQFVGALCIVSSLLDNHPDPAACAVAARAAQ